MPGEKPLKIPYIQNFVQKSKNKKDFVKLSKLKVFVRAPFLVHHPKEKNIDSG